MSKYPISKEFFPYMYFSPPFFSAGFAGFLGSLPQPPMWVKRDSHRDLSSVKHIILGYSDQPIDMWLMTPRTAEGTLPCLVYFHGGGFVFGAGGYQYRLAKAYALQTPCHVAFVQYRLAPKHPFPTPPEDCYAAYLWIIKNAKRLRIDQDRIAVGGDSAGGALAAAVSLMARDRGISPPCFQMLIYPVTDRRMNTESYRRFPHTPMWNSRLSQKMWAAYLPNQDDAGIAYASPAEAVSHEGLPPSYIEVAEFDCLHDEGLTYGEILASKGIPVELHEITGAMHGYDIAEKAPTVQRAVDMRIQYMRSAFHHANFNKG